MEKVCAVISVHEGGIGLAGSQENYSPKVSWSPEGYIKSNSRVCLASAIYRPATKTGSAGGSGVHGGLGVGGGGCLQPDTCKDWLAATASLPALRVTHLPWPCGAGEDPGRRNKEGAGGDTELHF